MYLAKLIQFLNTYLKSLIEFHIMNVHNIYNEFIYVSNNKMRIHRRTVYHHDMTMVIGNAHVIYIHYIVNKEKGLFK